MNITDKKMGMWNHEYRERGPRVHAYETWRVDANGREYDFRGSYGECNCPKTKPADAGEAK